MGETDRIMTAIAALLALGFAMPAAAQQTVVQDAEWCGEWRPDHDRGWHCEVREATLQPDGRLSIDGSRNGGIDVEGWDRDRILVRARVHARARTDEAARRLASDVTIETAGSRVEASGPATDRRESWSVSYRVFVPRRMDLDLRAENGGIAIDGVRGRIAFQTRNGGIGLREVAGDVRGRTQNGGVSVDLAGDGWEGPGLHVETQNGGVRLTLPEDYSAELETGTVNGGMEIDFPIMVQGRIGRRIRTTLGDGGSPVRVTTTNGGVVVRRR